MNRPLPEPRVAVIEGERVAIFERQPPLPPTLVTMLEGGRDASGRPWAPLRVTVRYPLRLGGARPECARQDHRLSLWLEGFHSGSDGLTRYLHLQACADCGSVCVRDASYDTLENLPTGRLPLRRRDKVIGWYTGARPRQRVYT
ncbi:MAG TPA: hypothetical protein VFV72_02565 [Candidatus Limnocylindrales bacterium]|nr:hypothetical protein [Candidatus Limnocylindrales bacterium]